ncbi:MAG: hypothetical protein AB7N76_19300 [Planctomycetota bacterium]
MDRLDPPLTAQAPDEDDLGGKALKLVFCAWVFACFAGQAIRNGPPPGTDALPYSLGALSIPVLCAVLAAVQGARGLARRFSASALGGLLLAVAYLLLVSVGFLGGLAGFGAYGVTTPPSASEAQVFAQRLIPSGGQPDLGFFRARLQGPPVVQHAFAQRADVSGAMKRGIAEGVAKGGDAMVAALKRLDCHWSVLRVEPTRVLVRLLPRGGGINYLEMSVGKTAGRQGEVVVIDIHNLAMGEHMSQRLRTNLDRELGKGKQLLRITNELTSLLGSGQARAALRKIEGLPPAQAQERELLFLKVEAARQVGEPEYFAALDELARSPIGRSPQAALILIDHSIHEGDFQQAAQQIDALDRAVGGDPCLDALRAMLHLAQGDPVQAGKARDRALAACAELPLPHETALQMALLQANFEGAVEALGRLVHLGRKVEDYATAEPSWRQLQASEPYRRWRAAAR